MSTIIETYGGCIHTHHGDRAWFSFESMTACGRALRDLKAAGFNVRFVSARTESPMLMVWS